MKTFREYLTEETRKPDVKKVSSKDDRDKKKETFVDLSGVKDIEEAIRLMEKASLLLQPTRSASFAQASKDKGMVNRSIHKKLTQMGATIYNSTGTNMSNKYRYAT